MPNPHPAHEKERNHGGGPGFTRATTSDPSGSMHRLNDERTGERHSEARAGGHWLLRKGHSSYALGNGEAFKRNTQKGVAKDREDRVERDKDNG